MDFKKQLDSKLNWFPYQQLLFVLPKINRALNLTQLLQADSAIWRCLSFLSDRRRLNWMMALGDGKLSAEDYSMLIDKEESRMKEIKTAIQEVAVELESAISTDELKEMILNLKDNWNLLKASTQKEIIQGIFRKIVVKKEENDWSMEQLLTV